MAERLVFDLFANDQASAGFAAAGRSASAASDDVMALGVRLDEIGRKSEFARVGLSGDKDATAQLDKFDLKLLATGRRVVDPNITLEGAAKAAAEIAALDAGLDRLGSKVATPRVSVGGVGAAAAAEGAGGASGGGGGASSLPGPLGALAENPVAGASAAGAALAALPFIAQAAAGAIVTALGGALAAVAIIGASKTKEVADDFASLGKSAGSFLTAVSKPFNTVLLSIEGNLQELLSSMVGPMSSAIKTIAGPFTLFADKLIQAFGQPVVATSIQAVASAFGGIMKAIAPTLAGDIADIAIGITNISKAIGENPGAFADFISDLFKVAGGALDIISALTRVANWVEKNWDWIKWIVAPEDEAIAFVVAHFDGMRHDIADVFNGIRADVHNYWDLIWNNSIGRVQNGVNDTGRWFSNMRHSVANIFDGTRGDIASEWSRIWSNTIGRVSNGIADVVAWFRGLPGRVMQQLGGLGNALNSDARTILRLMLEGLVAGAKSIVSWAAGFGKDLLHDILSPFHLGSPSKTMYTAGMNIMKGLANGILDHVGLASGALGAAGAGVQRWAGTVATALRLAGLPQGLAGRVLYQMQTESGGNPNAINLTDINAQEGDPSRGLMQVIGATFNAFAGPLRGRGIYDPLANIYAAIEYARAVYGPTLMSGGSGLGSGHGYALGTASAAPGLAWVGERGPELVRFRGGEQVAPYAGRGGGTTYIVNVNTLVADRNTGRVVVEAIKKFEKGSGAGWRK